MALAVTTAVPSGAVSVCSAAWEASPEDACVVSSDFAPSDFAASAFDLARRVVAALVSVSVLVSGSALVSILPSSRAVSLRALSLCVLAAALRSFELLRAALSDAAALPRERLSDAACASSERRGAGALSWVRLSLLLAAVLLPTSAAKLSFPADGSESGRADFAAAF